MSRKAGGMSPKIVRKKPEVCVLVFKYDHGTETASTLPSKSKGRKSKRTAHCACMGNTVHERGKG
jgi:hypothetical protein